MADISFGAGFGVPNATLAFWLKVPKQKKHPACADVRGVQHRPTHPRVVHRCKVTGTTRVMKVVDKQKALNGGSLARKRVVVRSVQAKSLGKQRLSFEAHHGGAGGEYYCYYYFYYY